VGETAELWDFGTIRRDLPGGGRGTVSRGVAPPLPPMPSVSSRAPNPQPSSQSQQQQQQQQRQHQQYASQPAQSTSSSSANRYGSVRSRNSGSLRAKASGAYAPTASGFSDASTLKNGTVGRSHQAYDTVRYTPEPSRQLYEEDDDDEAGLAYDLSDEEPPARLNGMREPQQGSVDEPSRHPEDEVDEGDDETDDSKAILDDVVVPVIDSVRRLLRSSFIEASGTDLDLRALQIIQRVPNDEARQVLATLRAAFQDAERLCVAASAEARPFRQLTGCSFILAATGSPASRARSSPRSARTLRQPTRSTMAPQPDSAATRASAASSS